MTFCICLDINLSIVFRLYFICMVRARCRKTASHCVLYIGRYIVSVGGGRITFLSYENVENIQINSTLISTHIHTYRCECLKRIL